MAAVSGKSPQELVQQHISEMLIDKLKTNSMSEEDEIELRRVRNDIQSRVLRYSLIGLMSGVLAATPFKNRAKARLLVGSVGTMAGIQYGWYTSTEPALSSLMRLSTPLGGEIRRIVKQDWPDSPLLTNVRSSAHQREWNEVIDTDDDSDTVPMLGLEKPEKLGDEAIDEKSHRRNKWGDVVDD
uniref:Uncharacterized protein n=1 Tax=Spongospora subterranea TaxID=70186 RepID=A0A0H5RAS6_9EUKA|eukprot:CRZ10881.1 hypothetical protein [Spongospora subterranea]